LTERAAHIDVGGHVALYDNFRREILAYHLGVSAAALPALTSLEPEARAQAA
jgi:hypothetical protein